MDADRSIYGIDFSGAKDAGNKIWIARGMPKGNKLLIEECSSARRLLKSGKELLPCLAALVGLIRSSQDAAFGFDFSFGLPASLAKQKTWEEFVLGFQDKYESPELFREACRQDNEGHELKRKTDTEARTPFSPYNLQVFKQTYYGISEVLLPLVREDSARIVPFQKPVDGKPYVLEVCPASSLKWLMKGAVPPYKGPEEEKGKNRREILDVVKNEGVVLEKDAALEDKIIANKGGDALDSVIAALAAFKAVKTVDALIPDDNDHWKIEGYVYV